MKTKTKNYSQNIVKKFLRHLKKMLSVFSIPYTPYVIRHTQNGFTLVETLVAITVLLLAVTGPLTIAARSLNSANFSQDQITAFYLAQEGVEAIRNIRDKNAIAGQLWLTGLENCQSGSSCTIDSTDNSVSLCSGSCQKIKYNSSSGLYGYNAGWGDSKFTRTIQISETSSAEAMITVTISWQSGNINRQFTVNENVLNWQQG